MAQLRCSTVIGASVERVWAVLRDFNGHDRWHPAVAASDEYPITDACFHKSFRPKAFRNCETKSPPDLRPYMSYRFAGLTLLNCSTPSASGFARNLNTFGLSKRTATSSDAHKSSFW